MKRLIAIGFASAAILCCGMQQVSAVSFTFEYVANDGSVLAVGSGNAADLGGGAYLATSGSVTITDTTIPGLNGTYTLMPGGPSAFYSPSGYFIVDNLILPSQAAAGYVFDNDGLLFGNPLLPNTEVNIFGNGGMTVYSAYGNTGENKYGTLTVTVPDGGTTVAMLGLGMLALNWVRRKV